MTRWLVTGAGGMLGREVTGCLRRAGAAVIGLGRPDLDITDAPAVRAALRRHRPEVIVNCAAWTAVDAAETAPDRAMAVNGDAVRHLALACAAGGARLVQVSTDYVFAGDADRPYDEDSVPAPRTVYGRTKLAGERAVLGLLPEAGLVVRTAWLYGGAGPSFVHTMMRLARAGAGAEVVTDQRGQPTWTGDVADAMIALVQAGAAGICHLTSSGSATWYDLAVEVFSLAGADPGLVSPVRTESRPRPAARPAYSVLGYAATSRPGVPPIGEWRAALRRAWPWLSPLATTVPPASTVAPASRTAAASDNAPS